MKTVKVLCLLALLALVGCAKKDDAVHVLPGNRDGTLTVPYKLDSKTVVVPGPGVKVESGPGVKLQK